MEQTATSHSRIRIRTTFPVLLLIPPENGVLQPVTMMWMKSGDTVKVGIPIFTIVL